MHVYCNFLLLTSNNNLFGPPTFFGWLRHCGETLNTTRIQFLICSAVFERFAGTNIRLDYTWVGLDVIN